MKAVGLDQYRLLHLFDYAVVLQAAQGQVKGAVLPGFVVSEGWQRGGSNL